MSAKFPRGESRVIFGRQSIFAPIKIRHYFETYTFKLRNLHGVFSACVEWRTSVTPWTTAIAYEHLRMSGDYLEIIANWWRIAFVTPFATIFATLWEQYKDWRRNPFDWRPTPVAEWLGARGSNFLNCSGPHRCWFEPGSGHMPDRLSSSWTEQTRNFIQLKLRPRAGGVRVHNANKTQIDIYKNYLYSCRDENLLIISLTNYEIFFNIDILSEQCKALNFSMLHKQNSYKTLLLNYKI